MRSMPRPHALRVTCNQEPIQIYTGPKKTGTSISSLFLLELASDFCINKELSFDFVWASFFIIGTFLYAITRFLVKKTSFLK
jgi:hypothetical protein